LASFTFARHSLENQKNADLEKTIISDIFVRTVYLYVLMWLVSGFSIKIKGIRENPWNLFYLFQLFVLNCNLDLIKLTSISWVRWDLWPF
jgi:hypothetical protein